MHKVATFAAGCFWGIEAKFSALDGVIETEVGYMGGQQDKPDYKTVCTDQTGHAEVVQVQYDEQKISYEQLLAAFWAMHDPTTLNRQGPDVGSQYRSAIFYHDETQQQEATQSKSYMDQSGAFSAPIVTQVVPAATFWRAEEYHQQYLAKRGLGSCSI
ncbi:peptide-methionine (S)-S-oxide reductase MsrA [Neptunomonas sp. XY-337]|uniref:peptide-methionine (S)-S-oxide reductase MsrA n=1 Tax=Neptunomonas sp. XY-337 TaxID=2561897 RepID=UPI0010AAA093|nr:peptide-methionine (S)-S-oxide reductase MsrA [Neptunomonas sp. XY-337]